MRSVEGHDQMSRQGKGLGSNLRSCSPGTEQSLKLSLRCRNGVRSAQSALQCDVNLRRRWSCAFVIFVNIPVYWQSQCSLCNQKPSIASRDLAARPSAIFRRASSITTWCTCFA